MNLSIEDDEPKAPLALHPDIATKIWNLNIVPKLKHFLWRYASKAIGIAENLRRRNMNVNPYCSRCCNELETNDHTLFSCPSIRPIWRAAGIPTQDLWDRDKPFEGKIRFLLDLHDNKHIDKVCRYLPFWLLWRIWKTRNDLIFNHKVTKGEDIVGQALIDTKEWLDCQDRTHGPQHDGKLQGVRSSRSSKWCKPERGYVKCNFDASHYEGNQSSGLGRIIRDSNGTCLDCGMGKFQGRQTIEEAECSALIWAIQASWALGYRHVEFEGDNANIVNLINEGGINLRLKHYMEEIWQWRNMFNSIKFTFRHREQNGCADLLARKAVQSPNNYYLYHCCPSFLNSLVNNDADSVF
ncbi:hypothetical protein ARALYDRAFT_917523 [Arabidopsis lyrata subsp. lyrata]|uniref:RNase H type-1 domain-containing protein n=1 Tax=Arabidopsis lyrata subsp. lyrata TaxID=81972 RepID=D7MSS8_ARALL|nr:uncharacterized protein LOC9301596 [Arabidopsis lyrata subsp. lyrata]EFH41781.1 hypothetical protein ARALYDRAFT_917523 [Arabidopsis lyrata subsp. lyrata]|eukprot:XP_002865522.1 uncharacterized protein LOC9301596 [Arabidopsis lyrata subsp. lyrata]